MCLRLENAFNFDLIQPKTSQYAIQPEAECRVTENDRAPFGTHSVHRLTLSRIKSSVTKFTLTMTSLGKVSDSLVKYYSSVSHCSPSLGTTLSLGDSL